VAVDWNEWNKQVIEEFRANAGKVGGNFEGSPMVLLHTTGAKTGKERVNPLMYLPEGDKVVVFASKGGAPESPDWFHNLKANPDVTMELGTETVTGRATIVDRAERDRLYAKQAAAWPQFADYEKATDRVIPVVVIEKV
jgi:deazaflavin-dependent oxidoreductase (nitroreductase family)